MDQRRKRVSLTIFQKVEILKKLQHGSSVKMIQEEYNVGKSTIYDLRSNKEKIIQYAAECESANLMKNRKTMKPAKFDELDRVCMNGSNKGDLKVFRYPDLFYEKRQENFTKLWIWKSVSSAMDGSKIFESITT